MNGLHENSGIVKDVALVTDAITWSPPGQIGTSLSSIAFTPVDVITALYVRSIGVNVMLWVPGGVAGAAAIVRPPFPNHVPVKLLA